MFLFGLFMAMIHVCVLLELSYLFWMCAIFKKLHKIFILVCNQLIRLNSEGNNMTRKFYEFYSLFKKYL